MFVIRNPWNRPKTFVAYDPVFDQALFTIRDKPSTGTHFDMSVAVYFYRQRRSVDKTPSTAPYTLRFQELKND